MPNAIHRTDASANRGFTLVEIMVALMIGMIAVVIIMQTLAVQESYKRGTVGVGDAQSNGALAVYSIESELRMAGFGISHAALAACPQIDYFWKPAYLTSVSLADGCSATVGSALPPLVFQPVIIADGGGAAPDSIAIAYATDDGRVSPSTLEDDYFAPSPPAARLGAPVLGSGTRNASGAPLKVKSTFGFPNNGNVIVADVVDGAACVLMQVSSVDSTSDELRHHGETGTGDPNTDCGTCQYNPPDNQTCKQDLKRGARVFNIGTPITKRFFVNVDPGTGATELRVSESNQSPALVNLAGDPFIKDVINIQAQYGKDTTGNGAVDTYDTAVPADAAGWRQLRTVRFAVLARSANADKPVNGDCDATTAHPQWAGSGIAGGALNIPGDLAGDVTTVGHPSRCFRYRVFETEVPLRNLIWRDD